MSKNIFGEKLRFARLNCGWTQEQLAEKAGLPTSSIAQFETDVRKPSYDSLRKLTVVLDISADYLLGIVDELTIALPVRFAQKMAKMSGDDRALLDKIIELLIARNTVK